MDMQQFTSGRNQQTQDEIWFLEHEPVFTYGISSEKDEILSENSIPMVTTDRGGKVTYHCPGRSCPVGKMVRCSPFGGFARRRDTAKARQ